MATRAMWDVKDLKRVINYASNLDKTKDIRIR